MPLQILLLILLSVALSSSAQLVLKLGIGSGAAPHDGEVAELVSLLTNPAVLCGLLMYGLAAIVWLFVLARAPLSLAYPFVGLGFIVTMVAGYAVLGEALTAARLFGTVLIAVGCVLVARSA